MKQLQIITYNSIAGQASGDLFKQLMDGIPTIPALEFIVERQNRVIFKFSDTEGQKNTIYEMRLFLEANEVKKVDEFIAYQQYPVLFINQSCLDFYVRALQNPNQYDRALSKDEIRRVYLAYLLCNEKWTTQQEKDFKSDREHPEQMLMKVDMMLSEFKKHKDFKAALYKATQLFRFCENNPDYLAIVEKFLLDHHIDNWRVYLSNLFELYCKSIGIDGLDTNRQLTSFEEQYSLDLSLMVEDNSRSLNWLRDHFLVKKNNGTFLILNNNLIVDKMYQGLKFDLAKVAKENGCKINGKCIETVGDLNEDLGKNFSEEYLMYDLMEKIYGGWSNPIVFNGKDLVGKIDAEPDYYLREGNKLLLIEHKDVLLSEKNKQHTDIQKLVNDIADKICREKTKEKGRKGGPQLLYSMDGIFVRKSMEKFDSEAPNVDFVYPIITVVDSAFSSLGVALATVKLFAQMAQNYEVVKNELVNILPVTIIDIDTLLVLSKRLHDGELDLFTLIDEYQKVLCTTGRDIFDQPSFSSFIEDNYPLEEIKQEDNQFFLANFMQEIDKLDNRS